MKIVKTQLPAPPPPPATFMLELSEKELGDLLNFLRLAIQYREDMMRAADLLHYDFHDAVVERAEKMLGVLRSV